MKAKTLKRIVSLTLSAVLLTASGCSSSGRTNRPDRSDFDYSSQEEKTENVSSQNENTASSPDNTSSVVSIVNNSFTADDTTKLYVTGINDKIAMRESDDEKSTILTKLSLKEEVELIDNSSEMSYLVSAQGKQGYVKKEYLTDEKMAACKRQDAFIAKKTSLYDTKDSDHNAIFTLNKNNGIFIVAKTSGDYWYVYSKTAKVFGYVNSMDISLSKIQDTSSAASSSASTSSSQSKTQTVQPVQPQTDTHFIGAGSAPSNYTLYYAKVNSGFLAIRSEKAFSDANIIGKMYTGDAVYVLDTSTGKYWHCYSPTNGVYGYVDSGYLVTSYTSPQPTTPTTSYSVWYVKVSKGYLALRSSAYTADSNIIGELYTGDIVYVYSDSYVNFTDTFWNVYAPSLGMSGYVNSDYIYDSP